MVDELDRPQRRAIWFQITVCEDPGCGIHLLSYDTQNGPPLCETVIGQESFPKVEAAMSAIRYKKAALKGD